MSTRIRPNISKSNKYYIPKHRYYELRHFVQQYPEWVRALREIDGYKRVPDQLIFSNKISDPTSKAAEAREYYSNRIKLITDVANETDKTLGIYILRAIIDGKSYEEMNAYSRIPCCRDVYYELYRRFFYILDIERR